MRLRTFIAMVMMILALGTFSEPAACADAPTIPETPTCCGADCQCPMGKSCVATSYHTLDKQVASRIQGTAPRIDVALFSFSHVDRVAFAHIATACNVELNASPPRSRGPTQAQLGLWRI